MKTVVIANQKGGVGKTGTLVHLAWDFMERGASVAVVDLDTQGNATYTLSDYASGFLAADMFSKGAGKAVKKHFGYVAESALSLISASPELSNLEGVSLKDAGEALRANIEALGECGFDVVLIDTAPSLGVALAAALYTGDYVMSPIELEAYSIQGIEKMNALIANIRQANPKLRFLGMMPSKVDARNPRHKRHLEELRAAYSALVAPVQVGLRSSIADALASGMPVWRIRKTAARKAGSEMRQVAAYVFNELVTSDEQLASKRSAQ